MANTTNRIRQYKTTRHIKAVIVTEMVIGILGAGQLGRMIAMAATDLGIKTILYAPNARHSPAAPKVSEIIEANYDDEKKLHEFGKRVIAVTTEFENVPAGVMDILAQYCHISPGAKALSIAQNRLRENAWQTRSTSLPPPIGGTISNRFR